MTGFATREGALGDWVWTWDVRSVNSRGLDLKLRVPDWVPGLEPATRKRVSDVVTRGAVSVALRLSRAQGGGQSVNPAALDAALAAITTLTERAEAAQVALSSPSALELLNFRGVSDVAQVDAETVEALQAALMVDLETLLPDFVDSRAREGAATGQVLRATLDEISGGVVQARAGLVARTERQAASLTASVRQILDMAGQEAPDPQRIAQELALLVVKADVSEELDRLDSHVAGAFDILNGAGPMGRRLDFLMQEFNREANTLCAKANDGALTKIGLDLKVRIDQMREQVQNLE